MYDWGPKADSPASQDAYRVQALLLSASADSRKEFVLWTYLQ